MKNGIVIVTYNRLELLKECLGCIFAQTLPYERVIVVDNHSTDGTIEYLKKQERPDLTVLYLEKNIGGAGGFAQGLRAAMEYHLDWITAVDDDAMLDSRYMEQMMDYAKGHKACVALSGTVMAEGKIQVMHRRRVTSKLFFVEQNVGEREYEKESFLCDCATFCGLTFRGDMLTKIGIPKEEYFLWYDDTEYSLRMQEYGGVINVNGAVLEHKAEDQSMGKGLLARTTWKHYYGYRNRYDVARVHFGRMSAFMVACEYCFFIFLSCLMCLNPKTYEHARFNIRMIRDALRDAVNRRLGWNETYRFDSKAVDKISNSYQPVVGEKNPEQISGTKNMEISE